MLSFSEYSVEIKDKEFKNPNGIVYPNTAIITFRDKIKKKSFVHKYGFVDTEIIYKKIEKGEDIILDNCYVHKFSLSEYRKFRGLKEEEYIKLINFSAKNAVFEAVELTDFSYADFGLNDVSFEEAVFINGEVSFVFAQFGKGKVSFTSTIFKNGNVDFSNCDLGDGSTDFHNTIFEEGHKNFQYAHFGKGSVSFANCEFNNGDVTFINVNFGDGDVSFKIARFGKGKKDFHFAKFGDGDINFERAEFGDGDIDFRTVEFNNGKINFNRAIFGNGNVDFEACDIQDGRFTFKRACFGEGKINFELANFEGGELYFDNTYFGVGDISFYNARFKTLSLRNCHLNNYLDLRVSKAELVDLSNTIVRDIIDLRPHDFPVDIKIINFTSMRLLGRIYIDWKENKVTNLINNQKETTERSKAEQFRTLKQNFNVTGQYSDEDLSYVEFKRYEAKAILHEAIKANPISALWNYPAYGFRYLVFDQMGLYATEPLRVLFSMVNVYILFSLLFFFIPVIIPGSINNTTNELFSITYLLECFYYSGVTYYTIGYGDLTPMGSLRVLAIIEGFCGVFMMSYFTVAFVRKILR